MKFKMPFFGTNLYFVTCFPLPWLQLLFSFLSPQCWLHHPCPDWSGLGGLQVQGTAIVRLPFFHTGPSPIGCDDLPLCGKQPVFPASPTSLSSQPLFFSSSMARLPAWNQLYPLNLCSATAACFIHLNPGSQPGEARPHHKACSLVGNSAST